MDQCKHDIRFRYYTELNAPSYYLRAECVHCGEAGALFPIKIAASELEIKQKRAFESTEVKLYGRVGPPRAIADLKKTGGQA